MDEFIEGVELGGRWSVIRRIVDGHQVTVHVKRCDLVGGLKHDRLQREGVMSSESDPDRRTARIVLYPACMAATESIDGLAWPMDFETFAALENEFANVWVEEVFRLNPIWFGVAAEEKKESLMTPTNG